MASRSTSRTPSVQAKARVKAAPPAPSKPGLATIASPPWVRIAIMALGALLLISLFTSESSDTDTWWHLKTGEYIVQQHKLPVPDPFNWATYMGKPAYPGEETTRYFNLTHEWLSQIMLYGSYAAGGFRGLILMRALWLTAFCAIAGLIAYRRTGGFYRSLGV